MSSKPDLTIVGGGLAGSEASWQAAQRGLRVNLYEMRPTTETGAHETEHLAELVCSNSLGSNLIDRASGLLKEELRLMGSLLIACAKNAAVPAGSALAVDRAAFSKSVSEHIYNHPNIQVIRQEVIDIPTGTTIIASGPLTSSRLSKAIAGLTGESHLFFYDAIAPIVEGDSIDFNIAFRASRYGRGDKEAGDYINCPLTRDDYFTFIEALRTAERIELKSFELELEKGVRAGVHQFFEGCLPVEILAHRGEKALAYGPMRPVGLTMPNTGVRPYAVVQLRQDNLAGTLFNMVGFQTNLKFAEQRRVFRMIPGLGQAEFVRYGQMHRNTFIFSPKFLRESLQYVHREDLFFAGQITGVEGYPGNIATGLLAGINAARYLNHEPMLVFPVETMIGSLVHYVTHAKPEDFQPMKANFGILPALEDNIKRNKRARAAAYSQRAVGKLKEFTTTHKFPML